MSEILIKHRNAPDIAIIRGILKKHGINGSKYYTDNNLGYYAGLRYLTIIIKCNGSIIKEPWSSLETK